MEHKKIVANSRNFNMSHAAGFTGYKPSPSKDINKEILKDNRIDVPSKVGKGFDKRALSIQM